MDNINTKIVQGDTETMSVMVEVEGRPVVVAITGYSDVSQAFKALYVLGQKDRLLEMAASILDVEYLDEPPC